MTCLSIFRRRIRESLFSREIWLEHSLIDKKQKCVGDFFILGSFLLATSNATRYANFSIVELDRSIKRQPIKIKEIADTLLDIVAL